MENFNSIRVLIRLKKSIYQKAGPLTDSSQFKFCDYLSICGCEWMPMSSKVGQTQGLYQTKGLYRIVISDYFRRFSELEFNTSRLIDKHFYAMGLWRKIRSVIAAILPSKYHFKSKTASDFELRSKSQRNFRFAKIPNDFFNLSHKISDSLILLV